MGGGFPNTELRSLSDKRVFEFFDFITLDDGEVPIEELVENLSSRAEFRDEKLYKRTFLLENNRNDDQFQARLKRGGTENIPLNSISVAASKVCR